MQWMMYSAKTPYPGSLPKTDIAMIPAPRPYIQSAVLMTTGGHGAKAGTLHDRQHTVVGTTHKKQQARL